MKTHNVHGDKKHLNQPVVAAADGETIIIAKTESPVTKLMPTTSKRRGMLPDMRFNAEAFEAMDSEIADLFK